MSDIHCSEPVSVAESPDSTPIQVVDRPNDVRPVSAARNPLATGTSRRSESSTALAGDIRPNFWHRPFSDETPPAHRRMRSFTARDRAGLIAASAIASALFLLLVQMARIDAAEDVRHAEAAAEKKAIAQNAMTSGDTIRISHAANQADIALHLAAWKNVANELRTLLRIPAAQCFRVPIGEQLRQHFGCFVVRSHNEALQLHREVLTLFCSSFGLEHPETLLAMGHLADACHDAGDLSEAIRLREQLLMLRRKVFGWNHPDTLAARNALTALCEESDRREISPLLPDVNDAEALEARRLFLIAGAGRSSPGYRVFHE